MLFTILIVYSHSGPALIIIVEHAFFVWQQKTSVDCIAAVIDLYKESPNSSAVIQAVDEVLNKGKDLNFEETFGQRLIQIVMQNRLCMSQYS